MTRWQLIKEITAAQKDPARIGDIPVLKGELTGVKARAEVEAALEPLRGYCPRFDASALRALPKGSFGHEYGRFMAINDLNPITLTGNMDPEMVHRNAFIIRYGVTHDMIHVITGFDTSRVGEAGVWGFAIGQRLSPTFWVSGLLLMMLYPLASPLNTLRIWGAFRRGYRMGQTSKLMLAVRFEERFEQPLESLRQELDVTGAGPDYIPAAQRSAA